MADELARQLRHSTREVSLSRWLSAVAGSISRQVKTWEGEIALQGWFKDESVQKALQDFTEAKKERDCLEPFAELVNYILDKARGKLTGVAAHHPYPAGDLTFVANAATSDKPRLPHVILTRSVPEHEAQREAVEEGHSRCWSEVYQFLRFRRKESLQELLVKLSAARKVMRIPLLNDASMTGTDGLRGDFPSGVASNRLKRQHLEVSGNDDASQPSSAKKPRPEQHALATRIDSAAINAAYYALGLMSFTHGTRLHCVGHVVKDDLLTPWYYDASGMVCADESISIIQQFPKFAAFIVAMASLTLEEHGVMPTSVVRPASGSSPSLLSDTLTGRTLTMYRDESNKRTATRVTLEEHLFTQYSLVGRRTVLYAATIKKPRKQEQKVVVKLSYQLDSQEREQDLLKHAHKAGVPHLPTIERTADLWTMSDGVRRLFHGDTMDGFNPVYEIRSLCAIMFHRYRPLKELFAEHCLLIPVMVDQMIDCLLVLRRKAGILHHNINSDTIMYEVKDGKYNFVLVDFDMATRVTHNTDLEDSSFAPACKNCTGTLPFMARELIKDAYNREHLKGWAPVLHRLRQDLESLFYVSIWCLCWFVHRGLTKEQVDHLSSAMLTWERADDLMTVARVKDSFCVLGTQLVFSPSADPLRAWLIAWRGLFVHSYTTTEEHVHQADLLALVGKSVSFDWETLNDTFTPELLKEALTPHMPVDATETVLDSFVLARAYGLNPGSKPSGVCSQN